MIDENEDDDDSYDFGQIENVYDDRIINDGFLWKGCFKNCVIFNQGRTQNLKKGVLWNV